MVTTEQLREVVGVISGRAFYDLIPGERVTGYLVKPERGEEQRWAATGHWYNSPNIGDRVRFQSKAGNVRTIGARTLKLFGIEDEEILGGGPIMINFQIVEGGELIEKS